MKNLHHHHLQEDHQGFQQLQLSPPDISQSKAEYLSHLE